MTEINLSLREQVKVLLSRKTQSNREVAKHCSVSEGWIRMFLTGEIADPSSSKLERVRDYLMLNEKQSA